MPPPYIYTQQRGQLNMPFEGDQVSLTPGGTRTFDDACTMVRFVNAVRGQGQGVKDETDEGLQQLQDDCTASGGGPGGAPAQIDPPPTPPPVVDPGATDGGAPPGGAPESSESLGAPDPAPAGGVGAAPREAGTSDGRPLQSQVYSPRNPMPDYDAAAILAGQGLTGADLDAALLDVLHNDAPDGEAHPDFGIDLRQPLDAAADPVILFTGAFSHSVVDVDIRSAGPSIRLVRTYRSGRPMFGPWGFNWDHSYNVYLRELRDGGAAVWGGELGEDVYTPVAAGGFDPPAGVRCRLDRLPGLPVSPDRYELTDPDGLRKVFERPAGWPITGRIPLVRVEDRHGRGHDVLYDGQGRLVAAVDDVGRYIRFEYGDCGLLEHVRDHNGRVWRYDHDDEREHLARAIGPATPDAPGGQISQYEYDIFQGHPALRHNLTRLTDPDGNVVVENTYGDDPGTDDFGRVVRQDYGGYDALFRATVLQYVPRIPDAINVPALRVEVIDPGIMYVYTFNYRGDVLDERFRLVLDGSNRLVARTYVYDEAGNLLERREPNGFGLIAQYDSANADPRARGNATRLEFVAPPVAPVPSRILMRLSYEPQFHRVKTIVDEGGETTTFRYDWETGAGTAGDVVEIRYPDATLPDGTLQDRHEHFLYDAAGFLVEHLTGAGHRHGFTYGAGGSQDGHLIGITWDADGSPETQELEYNGWGEVVAFVDGLGRRIEHDVDDLGRLVAVRQPAIAGVASETRFFYTASGRLRREERPRGTFDDGTIADPFIANEYEHDIFGNLERSRFGVNSAQPLEYRYERDAEGRVHGLTDPIGRRTTVRFDERGLMLEQTEADGLPEAATWRFVYDRNGNRTVAIDPAGHRVDFGYDPWDRVTEITLPGAPEAERTRIRLDLNRFDRVSRYRIDGLLRPGVIGRLFESTSEFDERGRVWRRRLGDRVTAIVHDPDERAVEETNQLGATTRFEYDGKDRVVRAEDAAGNRYIRTFDAAGDLVQIERQDQIAGGGSETLATTVAYDARSRPTRVEDPLGHITTVEHDDRDLRVREIDPLGRSRRWRYGLRGELIAAQTDTPAGPVVTQFVYDVAGRQVAYVDPTNSRTSYTFDARDRRTSIAYDDGATHSFSYGLRRQVASETTPGGTRLDYTYRPDAALTRIQYTPGPGVLPTPDLVLEADGLRRPVVLREGARELKRRFDANLRLIEESLTPADAVRIDYDDAAGVARLRYPDGRVDRYEYDPLGRPGRVILETVAGGLTGPLAAATILATYEYRGPERLERRTSWNGSQTQFLYDPGARLTGIDHLDPAGVVQAAVRYVFDAGDQRRIAWSSPLPGTASRASFDALGHLVDVASGLVLAQPGTTLTQGAADALIAAAQAVPSIRRERFVVDPSDTRTRDELVDAGVTTTSTYAVDGRHRIQQLTRTGPGAVVAPFGFDGDGRCIQDDQFGYAFDARGRLIQVRDLAAAVVLQQEFDPIDRVIQRSDAGVIRQYVHFGVREVERRDGTGSPVLQLAAGFGIDEAILLSDGSNRQPITDGHGTLLAVADDSGSVVERYAYRAFGTPTIYAPDGITLRAASAIGFPPRFAGHEAMGTGTYDARARSYKPETGRYLQPDPFGYADSSNVWAYVHGDPLNWIDPTGEIALLIGLAVAAGVGLLVGAGSSAVRQGIQIHEGSRDEFSWGEVATGGITGAVLGPALVLAPELAIPLAGLGVASAADQYSQGNWETGTFDLATSILPFGSRNVRSASFGRGSAFSRVRGLGPIDPFSVRTGRLRTIGQEFIHPDSGATRVTHLTTEEGLRGIQTNNTITPSRGQSGLSGLVDGTREGSWHAPWRASEMTTWRRSMTGLPFRRPFVEFDVRPGELVRPGRLKFSFGRYQRQISGPIDLAGRNPRFGRLPFAGPLEPPQPRLGDVAIWAHLPLILDPFQTDRTPVFGAQPPIGPSK